MIIIKYLNTIVKGLTTRKSKYQNLDMKIQTLQKKVNKTE
jgi:hypothetical protein